MEAQKLKDGIRHNVRIPDVGIGDIEIITPYYGTLVEDVSEHDGVVLKIQAKERTLGVFEGRIHLTREFWKNSVPEIIWLTITRSIERFLSCSYGEPRRDA